MVVLLFPYKKRKLIKCGFIINKIRRLINAESQYKSEHFTHYCGQVTKTEQNITIGIQPCKEIQKATCSRALLFSYEGTGFLAAVHSFKLKDLS